ncbi:undecaprenyldiphospho-muramoylpentapeptide beta-N-acetylglucosaminyltransferase [Gloeocapsa sp. PCC 73106]|uniref:undecaprenyldiphospho-muramoylpentapeptide beta-N-acetylglucosaminyltransferase n=1 Tax=Gloeocapsa sp. PCC 73106 TaxID=102232 RepID=UPI0002AC0A40|nr:undecaprenyldiphospho-muramoylpentapeptide beta-N-acetylglucosaminyltransferase [Gloeocapsa sp. PCC 73106]ELR97133.1 UDP-N-acetylglucosamine--N-acetylmuramyl-(pentapeptide) pyrophosphoryl-undecaprenol N-acetylglucosamine transferase [Gloeocapsa sp. PCC 73106]
MRLLIAASGTGGHIFPALAVAEQLPDVEIEWLGVNDRLELSLVRDRYTFHSINVEGFQDGLGLKTFLVLQRFINAIVQVKNILQKRKIELIFTTGGYISAPAILASYWANIPVVLHESNYFPGKVTRLCSRWCHTVALGFAQTSQFLPDCPSVWVGNPVREQFLSPQLLELYIPKGVPLIVVMGGSQGALAINDLVRQAAPAWLALNAFVIHLTGNQDPDWDSLQHPQYLTLPFFDNMAGLLQRATLVISRAGSGSLTEFAVTGTPSILIPYPFAAEDHQTLNALVFSEAGAACLMPQSDLTAAILEQKVLELLRSPQLLEEMSARAATLAVLDSAEQLANLLRGIVPKRTLKNN